MTEREKACLAWKTIGHAKDVIRALYGTGDGVHFSTPEIKDLYYTMVGVSYYFVGLIEHYEKEEMGEANV